MRSFSAIIPLFLPGVAISFVLAAALAPRVGHFLGSGAKIAFLLLMGAGVIVAATLTPDSDALFRGLGSDGACDFTRIGPPPASEVLGINSTSLNILLFVPLGVAVGLLPLSSRGLAVVLVAIMSPFLVEALQLTIPVLGRGCQSADVIDNLLGLALGMAAALSVRLLAR